MADDSGEVTPELGGFVESPAVADFADEGMMLVASSLRLALKNTIIVSALRGGADWNEEALLGALRRDIERLIIERQAGALRVAGLAARAMNLPGRAGHAEDFRVADVPMLARRLKVEGALVARLQMLITDREGCLVMLYSARDDAMLEMQNHLLAARIRPKQSSLTRHDRDRQIAVLRWQLAALLKATR